MGEYEPLPAEFEAVGAFGIILFTLIAIFSCYSFIFRVATARAIEFKLFFAVLAIMSVLELPRYIFLIVNESYSCVGCYAVHIVADWLFFICLAVVSLTFARILELGAYAAILYSKRGIIIAVIIQFGVDLAALIVCCQSTTLSLFFSTKMYTAFTIIDILQNCTYTGLLSFYGVKLILRLIFLFAADNANDMFVTGLAICIRSRRLQLKETHSAWCFTKSHSYYHW
jgi:hypothetical protein